MISCCFYVFLNNFFVPYEWTLNRVGVKFLTSNQHPKHACVRSTRGTKWVSMAPQKQKLFMNNLPKFCLSRNRAYPKFTVLVHFWLGQIHSLKAHKILAKVKTFQKTTSSAGIWTNTIPGLRIFSKLYGTVLYHNNRGS